MESTGNVRPRSYKELYMGRLIVRDVTSALRTIISILNSSEPVEERSQQQVESTDLALLCLVQGGLFGLTSRVLHRPVVFEGNTIIMIEDDVVGRNIVSPVFLPRKEFIDETVVVIVPVLALMNALIEEAGSTGYLGPFDRVEDGETEEVQVPKAVVIPLKYVHLVISDRLRPIELWQKLAPEIGRTDEDDLTLLNWLRAAVSSQGPRGLFHRPRIAIKVDPPLPANHVEEVMKRMMAIVDQDFGAWGVTSYVTRNLCSRAGTWIFAAIGFIGCGTITAIVSMVVNNNRTGSQQGNVIEKPTISPSPSSAPSSTPASLDVDDAAITGFFIFWICLGAFVVLLALIFLAYRAHCFSRCRFSKIRDFLFPLELVVDFDTWAAAEPASIADAVVDEAMSARAGIVGGELHDHRSELGDAASFSFENSTEETKEEVKQTQEDSFNPTQQD